MIGIFYDNINTKCYWDIDWMLSFLYETIVGPDTKKIEYTGRVYTPVFTDTLLLHVPSIVS